MTTAEVPTTFDSTSVNRLVACGMAVSDEASQNARQLVRLFRDAADLAGVRRGCLVGEVGALIQGAAGQPGEFRFAAGNHHQAILDAEDGRFAERTGVAIARRGVAHDGGEGLAHHAHEALLVVQGVFVHGNTPELGKELALSAPDRGFVNEVPAANVDKNPQCKHKQNEPPPTGSCFMLADKEIPMSDMQAESNEIREIRINPIVPAESVLVATARSMRPKKAEELAPRDTRKHVETCPFCRGNEDKTPPAILAWPDSGDWQIRMVENLYPVLGDDREQAGFNFGLQQTIDGYGRHEVIIDHNEHGIAVQDMTESHLTALFGVYQTRMRQLFESDERLKYVLVFKNFGPAAGASIPHTHSQVIAMPVVPENVHNEVENSRRFYRKNHQCIFCSLIDEALTFEATIYDRDSGEIRRKIDVGQYVIERGRKFIAIKPFASRYEWEVHILPLQHQSDFVAVGPEDLEELALVLQRTMARLDAVIGGAQYNYFLHSVPHDEHRTENAPSYHWHLEICPRTSIPTGFELGSGLFVNTISPEAAAQRLRNAPVS